MEYNLPVVVPDLGCFTIVSLPSEIQDGTVIPPHKTVKLDSENTYDDGVLKGYIARKANITVEQAGVWLRNFYNHNFLKKLPILKTIVFEEFGAFSLNEFNDIVFTPDENFFKENYGLDYAYFSGNEQTVEDNLAPKQEPIVVPETPPIYTPETPPVFMPETPPIFTPETPPIFTQETPPVFTPEPEPTFVPEPEPMHMQPEQPQAQPEDGLFDMNDTSRFRENPTRKKRPTLFDKKEEPVKPSAKHKPPPVTKQTKQTKPTKLKTKTGSSNLWVLWILIAAAGLGVGGYYVYPILYPILFSPNTTVISLIDFDDEIEPEPADDADEDLLNAELAQTLDDATDIKVALNPEANQQTEDVPTSQPQTQTESTPTPSTPARTEPTPTRTEPTPARTEPTPARTEPAPARTETSPPANVTPSASNPGQGRYVLIAGSFETRTAAENFCKRLQAEGIAYEIITATVNGAQWNRVSVGGYDTLSEATRQANQMKTRPLCKDVWVVRR